MRIKTDVLIKSYYIDSRKSICCMELMFMHNILL
nr:MAG TPA: hypothetical protein [Caudoviricetes sp.]